MKITHNCEIVPATPEHAAELAVTMREEDVKEIWRLNTRTPEQSLAVCLSDSEEAWTALLDGKVMCMFGVARIDVNKAAPWMLGTNDVPRNWRMFARNSRKVVAAWKSRYSHLVNVVDARYTASVRWLEWLGFTIHPVFLVQGTEPAHLFEMEGD